MVIKILGLRQIGSLTFYVIFLVIVLSATSCASTTKANFVGLINKQSVKLDSSIKYGRLPNGFSYFIKSLPEPQSKLYIRFYHKAGSNQECKDQIDVAHGLEHLAFKPTKNFPKGIGESESINKYGITVYDMLAYSGLTTEYYFDAPPNNPEALATAIVFFKDIANGLILTDEAINNVKGELKQEFLMAEGDNLNTANASGKLEASFFPCQKDESDYLERVDAQAPEVFRSFYRDWYRPDLLAISIVGNINDLRGLEEEIKKTFSDLKPPERMKSLLDCDSIFNSRSSQFFKIERSPVMSKNFADEKVNLEIIFRDPTTMKSLNKWNGIKRLILLQMLKGIASERLNEISTGFNSFSVGIRDTYNLDKLPSTLKIGATLEGSIDEQLAIQQILRVLLQMQKYGVSIEEWEIMKQKHLQYIKQNDVNNADYWITEIKNFYTREEALPDNKKALLEDWLSQLSLFKFNEFTSEFLIKQPEDVGLIAPSGHKALKLTEKEVRSWIGNVYKEEVQPYQSPTIPLGLLSLLDKKSLKKIEIKEISPSKTGLREVILNNGVKIVFKEIKGAVESEKNKIRIHGFALKGANCFPEEQFFSAVNAPNIISYSGVNGMNRFDISRFLISRNMLPGTVSTYIDRDEVGIQGSASLDNIEIVFQLIYLHFTKPNIDQQAFKDWKMMKYKSYQPQSNLEFRNVIDKTLGDQSVVKNVFGSKYLKDGEDFYEGIEKTNLDQAYEIYKSLFNNAQDFTFVISGDFLIEPLLPVAAKYFGNLPNSFSLPACISSEKENIYLSEEPKFKQVVPPGNDKLNYMKYHFSFLQTKQILCDWKEKLRVEALGWITTEKAWRLRYEMGLELYDVRITGQFNDNLNRYEVSSTIECVPEEYPLIRQELKEIFHEMKSGKISENLFQKGMFAMHFYYDLDKRGGNHLTQHQNLYAHYRYGVPLIDPAEVENFVNLLTKEDIIKTANKYFNNNNFYEFVMKDKD